MGDARDRGEVGTLARGSGDVCDTISGGVTEAVAPACAFTATRTDGRPAATPIPGTSGSSPSLAAVARPRALVSVVAKV